VLIALLLALTLDESATPAVKFATTSQPAVTAESQTPQLILPRRVPDLEPPKALRFVWREHPSLRGGRNFRLDFAAKLQYDGRDPGDNPDPATFPTWQVHRMRIGIEGEVFRHIQYSFERELTERETNDPLQKSTKTPWKDAYLEANYTDAAQVRGGKFKVPFGLDQTSGESELDFIYRSLGGNYLSPGREIGGMVHGRFFKRGLNYWAGWFTHDGENSRSSKIEGADNTIAGRVTVTPFRKFVKAGLPDAEVGVSAAVSQLANDSVLPNGLRARTVVSQFTFFEPMFVSGQRKRFGGDFDWLAGPFGARTEYMHVADTRHDQGIGDEDLNDVRGRAWYLLGTVVLTGEKKERPVEPKKPLLQGGVGAVEIAMRFDRIWFDSKPGQDPPFRNSRAQTVYPSGDRVLTLGLNWYVNRWVKLQFNAIKERLEDVERSPILDGTTFWSRIARLQIAL
jgi:phosphate-selective porin